jgi:hypothetical protein
MYITVMMKSCFKASFRTGSLSLNDFRHSHNLRTISKKKSALEYLLVLLG